MTNEVKKESLLCLWDAYGDAEKLFFHNPLDDKTFFAAIADENADSPFCFYSFDFFDFFVDDPSLQSMQKQGLRFRDYCFLHNGQLEKKLSLDVSNHKSAVDEYTVIKHEFFLMEDDFVAWQKMFEQIRSELQQGTAQKVVASRKVTVQCQQEIDICSVLTNLLQQNPQSFVFAYYRDGKTFFGATPEILVQKKGEGVFSNAIAGTIGKDGINDAQLGQILLDDEKNNLEHQIVVEAIKQQLEKLGTGLTEGERALLDLPRLFHLKTPLSLKKSSKHVLEFVKALHPTPALGGYPQTKAMEIIQKFETHSRGSYGAPLGLEEKNGDGIFVVGIRSAVLEDTDKTKIYAYAGCGLLEESDCLLEYQEISNKLNTILDAL